MHLSWIIHQKIIYMKSFCYCRSQTGCQCDWHCASCCSSQSCRVRICIYRTYLLQLRTSRAASSGLQQSSSYNEYYMVAQWTWMIVFISLNRSAKSWVPCKRVTRQPCNHTQRLCGWFIPSSTKMKTQLFILFYLFLHNYFLFFFAHKALYDATVPYSTRISFFLFRCIMYSLA